MDNRIQVGQLYPRTFAPAPIGRGPVQAQHTDKTFHSLLQEKFLRFSHHAEQRLQQRGLTLNKEQLDKMNNAIDKAAAKGSKDSLILYADMAFIVSVKNRTVVTAMDSGSMKDNVFTHIDSAVVIT